MGRISRRTFNNILIIGTLVFIAMMHLPDYIRAKLAENSASQEVAQVLPDGVIALVPESAAIKALQFPQFTLTQGLPWQTDRPLDVSATELANRWLNLSGTEISGDMFEQLKPGLHSPSTLVVDLGNELEPYRLTYYELPQFWLIQNWEKRWLAVSVEPNYLFPLSN
ncbi:hypothetical protein [Enterovibrio norvegicus]|uniref:Uncharacterized protein n=1 Tax=Enterovibrio norvegicus TaxID=188144 RepID=A0A2N7LED5_9GAMM|nr:hypothetical protein [Enterovibrio norvegicus]PML79740.1 hypothetical protein BCT69_12705 [Enterovibrio norvegicus]PMN69842.1 hypothetical protein BCT27_19965 [Enterovibrio norvegicus]PMN93747.1 hypothetical protein BCT23_11965 [Enterovibrio norvegicus]